MMLQDKKRLTLLRDGTYLFFWIIRDGTYHHHQKSLLGLFTCLTLVPINIIFITCDYEL